jgi:cyclase
MHETINVPLTAIGGAGKFGDIVDLVKSEKLIGAAAGSLFVFKGKYRAVLINYPSVEERQNIFY